MRDITVDFLQSGEEQEAAMVLGLAFITNPNSVAIWRAQGEDEILKQSAIFRLLKLERPKSTALVARIDSRIVGTLTGKWQLQFNDTVWISEKQQLT